MNEIPEATTERITSEDERASPEPAYISIAEAADLLGVQTRSVYCYLEDGSLAGVRVGRATMLRKEEVLGFQRRAPGRTRINTPPWHIPPVQNLPYLTMITVHIRAGQEAKLESRLRPYILGSRHNFPDIFR